MNKKRNYKRKEDCVQNEETNRKMSLNKNQRHEQLKAINLINAFLNVKYLNDGRN